MAKKNSAKNEKKPDYAIPEVGETPSGGAKTEDPFAKISAQLPKEAQQRLAEIKKSLDKFQESLTKKFGNYIMGIALLPPQLTQEQIAALPQE
ncbi:hypothetical protein HYU12_01375, partial [Candidatus Woesearchaeota archaeon]|nr:hypothetical protein [Candidatus Woesearchaeota archaeon]